MWQPVSLRIRCKPTDKYDCGPSAIKPGEYSSYILVQRSVIKGIVRSGIRGVGLSHVGGR